MTHYVEKLRPAFPVHGNFFTKLYDGGSTGSCQARFSFHNVRLYFCGRALSYGDLRHSISASFYAVALSWRKCMVHYNSSPTSSPSVDRNLLRNVFQLPDRLIRNGTKHRATRYSVHISLVLPLVNEA